MAGLAAAPMLTNAFCDEAKPQFQRVTCVKNEAHTHDTRKITFMTPDLWPQTTAPIVNVVVRVGTPGEAAGCCACCKCPQPCACPRGPNGCCSCCKCPDKCGCPKKETPKVSGCCSCCKCSQPCSCPKGPSGCCSCCKCPGTCGCPKKQEGSINKPYNPIGGVSGATLTLLVKRYGAEAKMGSALHALSPGEQVDLKGPNQQKKLEVGKYQHYGFVAGGTGITPIIQAMRYILEHDTAKISLVTLNKSTGDILLRAELEALQKSYAGRLDVTHTVEQGNITEGTVAVYGELGAWSSTVMKKGKASPELLGALPPPGDGVMVMVCGRPGMTSAIAGKKNKNWTQGPVGGMLKDLGYVADQVWKI